MVIKSSIGGYIINKGRINIAIIEINNIFYNFRLEFKK
jgi:hypothetical protein